MRNLPGLKDHPVFSQLESSNLVATVGSHDNPASDVAIRPHIGTRDHAASNGAGRVICRSGSRLVSNARIATDQGGENGGLATIKDQGRIGQKVERTQYSPVGDQRPSC
jgi:hypothetical protein